MTIKTDSELQDLVHAALRAEVRLDPTEVGVGVHRGVVTLSGEVRSFAESEAAEEAALAVTGVLDVANEIQIESTRPNSPSDAEVAHSVRMALESQMRCSHEHIKSCVSHGIVTLHGTVDSWHDVVDAEEAVGSLEGVQDVVDEVVVLKPVRAHARR
jgi:osmotically-inducible protein OsmY